MKTCPFIFAGFCVLVVGAIPVRAGEAFDFCIQQSSNLGNFSSYDNLTNFCKCFDYVFTTSFTQEQKIALGGMALLNITPPEMTKFVYKAKEKCSGYFR